MTRSKSFLFFGAQVPTIVFLVFSIPSLAYGGFISGTVTKNYGKEIVEGATVSAVYQKSGMVIDSSVTDGNGRYVLRDLASGKYEVMALGDKFCRSAKYNVSVVWEKLTPDINFLLLDKKVITLDLNQHDEITPIDGANISAKVLGGNDFDIFYEPIDKKGLYNIYIDDSTLKDGSNRDLFLIISSDNYEKLIYTVSLENGLKDITINLGSYGNLSGKVLEGDGTTPVPASDIVIIHRDSGILYHELSSDQNGNFIDGNISEGFYNIIASSEYDMNYTVRDVFIEKDKTTSLEIKLSRPATISGAITLCENGGPAKEAFCMLERGDNSEGTSFSTDIDGNYSVSGLVPGIYKLQCYKKEYDISTHDGIVLVANENIRVDMCLSIHVDQE